MINNQPLPLGLTLAWVFFLAVLGVTMAIPMKRQMINVEQLRFPTGIATAETLRPSTRRARAPRSRRARSPMPGRRGDQPVLVRRAAARQQQARAVRPRRARGPARQCVFGPAWIGRTVTFVWDPIFIAAGTLMGIRAAASIFVRRHPLLGRVRPHHAGARRHRRDGLSRRGPVDALGRRLVHGRVRAFGVRHAVARDRQGVSQAARPVRRRPKGPSELDRLETPMSWFVAGQARLAGRRSAWLAKASFNMPVWQSVLAVAMSFFLALVACRVTGETDTTPTGAMGKVTQLIFGALNPGT
jgi:hypothetical protein